MKKILILVLFVVASVSNSFAQMLEDVPFNGLILDSSGNPYAKVKITIAGNEKRTTTDKHGRFGLTNVPKDAVLNL